eukprot:TRINITY_DN32608_c0_g1_i1.p1 TRINITY_DN32608_c0_g1~~TRINITY_DN32608_c0_g1_i1.p1  ORF type:complete len:306 (+),score=91.02 TRINITY_DN32608_c0_g1_i1:191-1108(+)
MEAIRGAAAALGADGAAGIAASPYYVSTVPHLHEPDEERPTPVDEAWTLSDIYRRMLDVVAASEADLEHDQERLAELLARAQNAYPPREDLDIQVFLLHEGLELRLRELDEECRRLHAMERRLQRGIEEAEAKCEIDAIRVSGLVDPRLLDRLLDQRRVISLQQEEIEQARFERDVLADDAARMREAAAFFLEGDAFGDGGGPDVIVPQPDLQERLPRDVHARNLVDATAPNRFGPEAAGDAADPGADRRASQNPLMSARPRPKSRTSRRGSENSSQRGRRQFNFGQASPSSPAPAPASPGRDFV